METKKEKQTRSNLWSKAERRYDLRRVSRPAESVRHWEEPRVESKLGRTANGTSKRVDRLRLLGNGVVPDVATIAFVTLYKDLLNKKL